MTTRLSAAVATAAVALVTISCAPEQSALPVSSRSSAVSSEPVGSAASTARATGTITVDGAVTRTTVLTVDDLRGYAPHTESVTFDSSKGRQEHTYVGANLHDVLTTIGIRTDPAAKNPLLRLAVRATGSDGYAATVSWGEIDPGFGATNVLLAYREDGAPLPQPRLVVPGDTKGGRYVSGLTRITVSDLS